MLQLVPTVAEWRTLRAEYRAAGKRIGFVPTMGALHAGHAALMATARRECDIVLTSIFVNPTQFNEAQDFDHYPRTLAADQAVMASAGVDVVFVPSVNEMYPNGTHYSVQEDHFSRELCGAHRPGHFTGVLTVVMKLLQIAGADRAYFGEKDYQQLQLIRGMAAAFFLETEIVGCPTVREADGLAMSSRNTRLTPDQRAHAAQFPAALNSAAAPAEVAARLRESGFGVDYISDRDGRRFGAVHLGPVRLIDNVQK
jgi:pantoate--beta-alanine ligase|uniref:pantoate--beta-alanine ligase n=1 Tax=Cephaloticoccus sp. TaxID=1985742 RepID=UPI0040490BDC